MLYCIEGIAKFWHDASSSFLLTVLDGMQDSQGRIVAQLVSRGSASKILNVKSPSCQQQQQQGVDTHGEIEFLQ